MKKRFRIFAVTIAMFVGGIVCNGQSYFRSTTVDTGSQRVNAGYTQLRAININNLSTTILYVKLYNKSAKAYKTDTPMMTLQIGSNAITKASFESIIGSTFGSGLWIRCTTGATDTSTAQPTTKPIIEFGY